MEISASMTFLKAFLLTNFVVLSRHAVAVGKNTLCLFSYLLYVFIPLGLNESNLISGTSQYSSMKCFISSLLCFCGAQLLLLLLLLLLLFSLALEEPEKTIGRGGPNDGISYVNFVEDKFFFLNITALGGDTVDDMPECSFACLDTPSCFSFNLAAFPDISNKLLCELLPSDKYYNSDKFMQSDTFHHFSIAVSEQARKNIYM